MSMLIKRTEPIARKNHTCDAWIWFSNSNLGEVDFEPEDWKIIKAAESEGGIILSGHKYIREVGIYYGEMYTFKARFDMHAICKKYDIYQDD